MLLFNAVVLSVIVMLALSIARVHVVISLFVASLVGGLVAGMGISGTMVAFQEGPRRRCQDRPVLRPARRVRDVGGPLGPAAPAGELDHR